MALVLAFGVALALWIQPRIDKTSVPAFPLKNVAGKENPARPTIQNVPPKEPVSQPEIPLKKMADDLFILEMLGEDDNLIDDIGRVATDVGWQVSPDRINLRV